MAIGRLLERLYVSIFADTKGVTQGLNEAVRETSRATKKMSDDWVRVGGVIDRTATRIRRGTAVATGAGNAFVRSANLQRFQMQNLSYQINDIGVSLASGMALMTVAIQQGSQIQQIYAGQGGFRAMMGDIAGLLGRIARFLVGPIGLGIAATLGGFAELSRRVNDTTEVAVSFGDTFKAVFQVLWRQIYGIIEGPLKGLTEGFRIAVDFIVGAFVTGMNAVIGSVVFAGRAIPVIWQKGMDGLADATAVAFNWVITNVENALNFITTRIENAVNMMRRLVGQPEIRGSGSVDLSHYLMPESGSAGRLRDELRRIFDEALGEDYMGSAFDAIKDQAIQNALSRISQETDKVGKAASRAAKAVKEMSSALEDRLKAAAENFSQVWTDAFENFVRTGEFSVRELLMSINSMIARSVGDQVGTALVGSLTKSMSGGGPMSGLAGIFGTLFGGALKPSTVAGPSSPVPVARPFARGGLSMPWEAMIAGERGAELITSSGGSSARRVRTAGQTRHLMNQGGGSPVVANFNFYGPTDSQSIRQSQPQLASTLRRAVERGGRNS